MLYREAGVDIERMNAVKKEIGRLVKQTFSPQVISEVGLFGSLYKLPRQRNPVLVASCDSVGTKVIIAREMGVFDTVGIDIVNHCVNDILTLGAKPLFFLDYIAHSDLSNEQLLYLIKGLTRACRQNECALVGGETAMMPDIYRNGDFDLVGFIVGIVEQDCIIDAQRLKPGDLAIGIPSNGLHTNGYSLARKVLFTLNRLTVHSKVRGIKHPLGKELLRPHRSYYKLVYPILDQVKALAHITGGGFYDNISRLLPPETSCIIKKSAWRPAPIFKLIQELGSIPDEEMYRTFNMGIGMVLFVAPENGAKIRRRIPQAKIIGKVVRGTFGVTLI
ncbi:MAG: phosphoribosylformylglycinamidine cyclo-ligase [candidate division WOR-3 bacterium]|jgi:phosphoribosylformylglycinamidine cyclo-ligase|nr:phosphoribosylformylglycinamidine cyclo-ligase [candidate division WOR-3 bacterium]MCR4423326.1 phosphoribosylformylglycinamidine cyclo-ligase [candidate division WOR-3 bacterium]MDH7518665.1 phosphoribosylformylglycinamidine cyclo-ligase [bacterium]